MENTHRWGSIILKTIAKKIDHILEECLVLPYPIFLISIKSRSNEIYIMSL